MCTASCCPVPYSSEHSIFDAEELARNPHIETRTISICEPFEAFERGARSRACGGELSGLAAENTQARCRMTCLMALSNAHDWMMLNTGNKSESMTGYSTLYGDTAGAFAPMGGIYKTDVYAVARWRNDCATRAWRDCPHSRERAGQAAERRVVGGPERRRVARRRLRDARPDLGRAYRARSRCRRHRRHGVRPRPGCGGRPRAASYAFKRAMEPPYPTADFYA